MKPRIYKERGVWWVRCKHGDRTGPYAYAAGAFDAALALWEAYGAFVDERRRS